MTGVTYEGLELIYRAMYLTQRTPYNSIYVHIIKLIMYKNKKSYIELK